jgi:hypothetical protein
MFGLSTTHSTGMPILDARDDFARARRAQLAARFRPASERMRARWERVALAHRRGLSLPPIAVKQGPDGYYVVDGRHRVSVALATGRREIDAWVA